MKKIFYITFICLNTINVIGQTVQLKNKFTLPTSISESSGCIFFNHKLITHNDSGNENKLYELDTISASITRTITIKNATNTDWEDIAQDDHYIYIADIGNNRGNRKNLKVYKIKKEDYLNANQVTAEIINFSYSDQTDFSPNLNFTIWDAEALISFNQTHLILFTKNWVDGITKAYKIPKKPGTYNINPLPTTLNSGGRITGATYNPTTKKIYLVGYNATLFPFIFYVDDNYIDDDIFSGTHYKTELSSLDFEQIEGITFLNANKYFLTSESYNFYNIIYGNAKLFSLTTNDNVLFTKNNSLNKLKVYPNPVKNKLFVKGVEYTSIKIYDSKTVLVYKGNNSEIDLSHLKKGLYFVKIEFANQMPKYIKIIKN